MTAESGTVNGLLAWIIFAALSVHSLFEGLALGLATSPLTLFVAILLHKGLESLALACEFVDASFSPRKAWVVISAFACITPVGIAVGLLVGESVSEVVSGVLTGLSAGTFLYVGVVEMLQGHIGSPALPWYAKLFAVTCGAGAIIGFLNVDA